MELSEYKHLIEEMQSAVDDFRGRFDLDALNESIQENEARMAEPGFGTTRLPPRKSSMRITC